MKNNTVIGVYIYGYVIKFALINEDGKILKKYNSSVKSLFTEDEIFDVLVNGIKRINEDGKASCVGISFCGIVDRDSGEVKFSPHYGKWKGFKLKEKLQKQISIPIYIENDAKTAALGEKWFGEGKNCSDFVLLTLTFGVGAGAICNNHLVIGKDGVATEIGHFTVDPDGPVCSCGKKGCIESYISEQGLLNRVKEKIGFHKNSILSNKAVSNTLEVEDIFKGYKKNDELSKKIIDKAVYFIGIALSYLVNVFNPEKIIISGHLSHLYKPFLKEIKAFINNNVVDPLIDTYKVVFTSIKEDAFTLGAASLAFEMNKGYYSKIEKKELRNNLIELKRIVDKQTEQISRKNTKIIQTNKQLIEKEKELKRANEMLELKEERLKLALAASERSIWEYDIESKKISIQKNWLKSNNIDTSDFEYTIDTFYNMLHPDDIIATKNEFYKIYDSHNLDLSYRIKTLSRDYIWLYQRGKLYCDKSSNSKKAIGTIENYSAQKQKAEELEYRAHFDTLTNLPNRDFLIEKFYYEIKKTRKTKKIIGTFFIDIDNFKQINDSYSHHMGDKTLQIFTKKLKNCIKETDFLARYAGDEFVLLSPKLKNSEEAEKIAQRIMDQFTKPLNIQGKLLKIQCSIGISIFPEDSKEPGELIHLADEAMYRAKKVGKNNYKIYSEIQKVSF